MKIVISAAIEESSSILPNARDNKGLATKVSLEKVRHIMNYASDCNDSSTALGASNKVIP